MYNKAFIVIFITFLTTGKAFAQPAMITIVDNDKTPFYLYVDGLQENDSPKAKVRVKNLLEGTHHVKVIFEDVQIGSPQLKVDIPYGTEFLLRIKKFESGDRSWYGIVKEDQRDISINPKKIEVDTLSPNELKNAKETADSIYRANLPLEEIMVPKDTLLAEVADTLEEETPIIKTEFNCTNPLHPDALNLITLKLETVPTDEEKLPIIRGFIEVNCISSIQLMELLQYLEFEVSRLEVAIFAYPYCFDPKNYAFVEGVFEYETSISNLHNQLYSGNKGKK